MAKGTTVNSFHQGCVVFRRAGRAVCAAASGVAAAALLCLVPARPAIAETTITGVDGMLYDNVVAYLAVDDLDCEVALSRVRLSLGRAESQISEALNPFGFYDIAVATELAAGEDCWQATIDIDPGEPVRLRNVDIRLEGPAADTDEFRSLLERADLRPGIALEHGAYDRLKSGLLDLSRNRGYAEAAFSDSRIDVYPDELAADITLHFESGPRYSLGQISINQEGLDTPFVEAFHELTPGEPYDYRLLTDAYQQLNNSGYFASVDVRSLDADPVTREIPVQIDLTLTQRLQISYGVGYSTDTGPRLRFERAIRRLNDRGHQLSIDAQLSPVISEFNTIYRLPYGDPRYDWLNFSVGAKREETATSLTRSIEAGVRRVVDGPGNWARTQFLSFAVEDFEVGTQKGRPHLFVPGIDWTRLRGDDALRPANGSSLNVELRAANDSVLSDESFVQTTIAAKWIRSVSERSRVLLRGKAGYLVDDRFERLPPSVRYFAGGDASIRGFDYESVGPVDANGNVVGGDRLVELSLEFERTIRPRWSLAAFVDGGNAFNEDDFEWRTGAGLGARWRSPLGPVRIDVAWPVNDREHGARLHVSLGPDL